MYLNNILKNFIGHTFYSPIIGYCTLTKIDNCYIHVQNSKYEDFEFNTDGRRDEAGEVMLFPTKELRDWNKWVSANVNQIANTFTEYVELYKNKENILYLKTDDIPVCHTHINFDYVRKSAEAYMKIYLLIDVAYGGNVTTEEWKDEDINKYYIDYKGFVQQYNYEKDYRYRPKIAFHTYEQATKFIKYPENVKLIKDYYYKN